MLNYFVKRFYNMLCDKNILFMVDFEIVQVLNRVDTVY